MLVCETSTRSPNGPYNTVPSWSLLLFLFPQQEEGLAKQKREKQAKRRRKVSSTTAVVPLGTIAMADDDSSEHGLTKGLFGGVCGGVVLGEEVIVYVDVRVICRVRV